MAPLVTKKEVEPIPEHAAKCQMSAFKARTKADFTGAAGTCTARNPS